ncbi:hypothetical protein LIER_43680 [Lithospermum erythrorhizon]|uniref:Gag-pol polyprotein n=1 Tax=Lithospermum erythrorhizon TaxID=34254 RepID=A0AAV3QMU2_LITER
MDGMREGNSISRPPLLDETNYPYLESRIDSAEADWNVAEEGLSLGNSKAFNAIFCVVDLNIFKMISLCTVAKEALEVLQIAYEGTQKVRISRLQQLTTHWKNLKMEEDETISSHNSMIKDIASESFALGEMMSNEKLVRKILRTLPKRFAHKFTSVKEAQDLTTMRVDELVGNLTTFEITFDEGDSEKKKGLALKASTEEADEENLAETMNMLATNFNKTICGFNKKTQSKNYYTTLTADEIDEEEPTEEKVRNFVAFMGQISNGNQYDIPTVGDSRTADDNDEEELTQEELMENYELLFSKWSKLTTTFTINEVEKEKLTGENDESKLTTAFTID